MKLIRLPIPVLTLAVLLAAAPAARPAIPCEAAASGI